MNINRKIEEIRRKPEHIRMRYVWGAVAIAMFFIIIIWLFSLQETFKSTVPEESPSGTENEWNNFREEMPSLQEFIETNQETMPESYPADEITAPSE